MAHPPPRWVMETIWAFDPTPEGKVIVHASLAVRGLRRGDRTVVLTTHYIEEAEPLPDDVAFMVRGKIVASGSPDRLVTEYSRSRGVRLLRAGFEVLAKLREERLDVGLEGEEIVIHAKPSDNIGEIFSQISPAAVAFEDVVTARLEDVFLNIVGAGTNGGS